METITTGIISAQGEKTFSADQLARLQRCQPTFIIGDQAISVKEFIGITKSFHLIAVTRKLQLSLNQDLLTGLPKLRGIIVYATGIEWVDMDYLTDRCILFAHLEDYCSTTVAEHTMGMILALSRRIILSQAKSIKQIPHDVSLRGFELRGKRIGIIGMGRIGSKVAALASAFGLQISYTDVNEKRCPYDFLPMDELLSTSQIICLTLPYNGKAIIDTNELSLISNEAFIINPSRAALVNNIAMIEALKRKELYGYAVDDVIKEDVSELEHGRLLQTYHTAWYSNESIKRGTELWVQKIIKMYSQLT